MRNYISGFSLLALICLFSVASSPVKTNPLIGGEPSILRIAGMKEKEDQLILKKNSK